MNINHFVIPFHFKDLKTVGMSCDNIQKLFSPKRIYAIGSQKFSSSANIEFIHENDIKDVISTIEICKIWNKKYPENRQRGGWIYQQLIKLLACRFIKDLDEDYMISDADIIWTKNPYKNVPQDIQPLSKSFLIEWFNDAAMHYERLMGERLIINKSYINHHVLVKKSIMKEMIDFVENKHGCRYDEAVIDKYDFKSVLGFSEYDSYANYCISKKKKHLEIDLKVKKLKGIPSVKDVERYTKEEYWDFLDCPFQARK